MAIVFLILELIFSGETLKKPAKFSIQSIAKTYYKMISTISFSLGLIMLGLAYSMVMIYNLTGPFIIEHHLNFSPMIIGYCSLILGFSWMIGGIVGKITINNPFVKKNYVEPYFSISIYYCNDCYFIIH